MEPSSTLSLSKVITAVGSLLGNYDLQMKKKGYEKIDMHWSSFDWLYTLSNLLKVLLIFGTI
jgi:hypothetical protein